MIENKIHKQEQKKYTETTSLDNNVVFMYYILITYTPLYRHIKLTTTSPNIMQ